MRWLIALSLWWTALARADASQALLAQVEADLARGQQARAEKRLLAGFKRSQSTALLARYAELAVPCGERVDKAKASTLLKQVTDEADRRVGLHAALAAASVGQLELGLEFLRAAVQRQDEESATCARQVAAVAVRTDALAQAIAALELANEAMPQDAVLRAELARLWLARGRIDRALPLLAERFALSAAALPARLELAYALAADGRADEALALLAPAREACDQDATCALTSARIALEAGHLEDALRSLRERLARSPDDVDALFTLADAHSRAHRLDEARTTYQRILRLRPESVRATQALQALTP